MIYHERTVHEARRPDGTAYRLIQRSDGIYEHQEVYLDGQGRRAWRTGAVEPGDVYGAFPTEEPRAERLSREFTAHHARRARMSPWRRFLADFFMLG